MPRDVDDRTLPADPTAALHAVTKQYCDANVSAYIGWAPSPVTDGIEKDGATLVGYHSLSARIITSRPLKITTFTVDMNNTGTFDVYLTNGSLFLATEGYPAEDRDSILICTNEVVSDAGNHDFAPASPLILSPGDYFWTIRYSDGVSTGNWNVKLKAIVSGIRVGKGNTLFYSEETWKDRVLDTSYVLNLYMTAYKGTWAA